MSLLASLINVSLLLVGAAAAASVERNKVGKVEEEGEEIGFLFSRLIDQSLSFSFSRSFAAAFSLAYFHSFRSLVCMH